MNKSIVIITSMLLASCTMPPISEQDIDRAKSACRGQKGLASTDYMGASPWFTAKCGNGMSIKIRRTINYTHKIIEEAPNDSTN